MKNWIKPSFLFISSAKLASLTLTHARSSKCEIGYLR